MRASELLRLDDLEFLRAVAQRYPEMYHLIGKAEATPEGNPILKESAWTYQVFPHTDVEPTAIEAERTLVSLLCFKWVLTNQYEKFTGVQEAKVRLTRASFAALHGYTERVAARTEETLEFCLYSIACNDLGKTQFCITEHGKRIKLSAADHDLLLFELLQQAPDLFPAFRKRLTPALQEIYIKGLGANLNLGQMVQGENFACNLLAMQALDPNSRELRLVCELFDFAGILGHVNASGSLIMTEENYVAYSKAIVELMTEPKEYAYQRYIIQRGALVGIDVTTPQGFAKARLATLARAFTPDIGAMIQVVWDTLSLDTQTLLTRELNITGCDGERGILLYYAPAVIANATKGHGGDFTAGLSYALHVLADVYRATRATACPGDGVITVNVSALAKEALQVSEEVSKCRMTAACH